MKTEEGLALLAEEHTKDHFSIYIAASATCDLSHSSGQGAWHLRAVQSPAKKMQRWARLEHCLAGKERAQKPLSYQVYMQKTAYTLWDGSSSDSG